jgi:hypothetical protein
MTTLEKLGFDEGSGRDLFAVHLETPESFPDELALSSPRFACLLAWDSTSATVDQISDFVFKLLAAGAVYVCTWGAGCERVHDIIDEVDNGKNPLAHDVPVIMTTWHESEALAEAIYFVLYHSIPDEGYAAGCNSTLAISIGNSGWHDEICRDFNDPDGFSETV